MRSWSGVDISAVQTEIDNAEFAITDNESDLSGIQRELAKVPGMDPRTNLQVAATTALADTFDKSIEGFRADLRRRVEKVASVIFRSLTTEPDYARLRINEQYGLEIIDTQERVITERSAGAEQIVALALVGALNLCAVREGPIVIDTPFARLDRGHRRNILKVLPGLGEQVVLLVQSGELDDEDLSGIAGRVFKQYRIARADSPTKSQFEAYEV